MRVEPDGDVGPSDAPLEHRSDPMSWIVRRAIIVLALVGFASAAASTYVHYQLV